MSDHLRRFAAASVQRRSRIRPEKRKCLCRQEKLAFTRSGVNVYTIGLLFGERCPRIVRRATDENGVRAEPSADGELLRMGDAGMVAFSTSKTTTSSISIEDTVERADDKENGCRRGELRCVFPV